MGSNPSLGSFWENIADQLRQHGIEIEALCGGEIGEAGTGKVKVVCVTPDLKTAVAEMDKISRDQVVMVRVDEGTSKALDAWVEAGAVRSRSEAAAVFIREGLKVRASELEQLRDALREVEQARSRLRQKAREVLGKE
jgi:hypothetical protein